MKSFYLPLVFLLTIIITNGTAQSSLGLRIGYVKSWMEYGDAEVPENAIIHVSRYQISGLMKFDVSPHFSVNVEPGFVQRGAACFPGWITFLGDTKLLLNYVELPLLASYEVPVFNQKFEIYGKAGFGISKAISAYRRISNIGTGNPPDKTKLNLKDSNLRSWDEGFYSGLGISGNFGNTQLFIEGDFYYGLRDVDELNTSRNRNIHIGLGFRNSL